MSWWSGWSAWSWIHRLKRRVAVARRARRWARGRPEKALFAKAAVEVSNLAWPIAAAMLGEVAIGLVDTKLVGGLGAGALGGVGVANVLMFLSYALVFGLMRGVKVRTAYAVGRGTPEDGARYAMSGVLMGGAIGFAVLVAARDVTPVLLLLGVDRAVVPYARDFLAAITCGAPATCALAALIQHRQGLGDARSPMVVGLVGNVVNAVLAWALIYGRLGLPALGVRGGGYGTAVTEVLELAAMLVLLRRSARRAKAPSLLSLRVAAREVCELGLPTGIQFGAEMLAFTTFTAILGSIGGTEIAAHQVALATIRVSFLPGVAIGEAASVLVGRALATRRLAAADRFTTAALTVAMAFMATCGLAFATCGGLIARAFTPDADVARVVSRLLMVAAVFQVLDAANIVLRGALRGAKDVRVPAYIGIGVIWTCVPGAAYWLGRVAGWGALGGWLGFVGETVLATILFGWRWRRGAWRDTFGAPAADEHASPELARAGTA
jgi:multidrug resistance protein, MATE family